MSFQLKDSEKVVARISFVDKKGNPATVDGIPAWFVDNPNVLTLNQAADGMSCEIVAAGPLGTATVSVKADADLGAGVTEIIGTADVEVTGGAAATVAINFDAPSEQ